MGVQFASPSVLLLLWLVPALAAWWWASARRRERRLATFVSPRMQRKLRPASSAARFGWQAALTTAGISLAVVAAGRPQWGLREQTVYERGRDLVIALDVSRSMLAADVHPNRLERAKADILDLIGELRGDRAALIAFRRTAALLCPLTSDYAFLKQALDAAGPDSAPPGETDIGNAIVKAMEAFESDESSHKAVILISDGEDLSGGALKAAAEAGRRKIPVFTVGLGNRAGARIPEAGTPGRYVAYQGGDVVTRLNHETLLAIARATGGAYVPVETASLSKVTLGNLYSGHLRRIAARDFQERREKRRMERYYLFLLPAVLALLAAAFLSRGRLMTSAPRAPAAAVSPAAPPPLPQRPAGRATAAAALVAAALLAWPGRAAAQTSAPPRDAAGGSTNAPPSTATGARTTALSPRDAGRAAQRLFLLGRYQEAADAYQEAAREAGSLPGLRRDLRLNAAVALYRARRYGEAAAILRDILLEEQPSGPDTAMNLGAALYRDAVRPPGSTTNSAAETAALLLEAAEAFKDAASAGGADDAARRNLAAALGKLEGARQEAKIEGLLKTYGGAQPFEIAGRMLAGQRQVAESLRRAATNDGPSVVSDMENAARGQAENADLWIPLKGKLLEAAREDKDRAALGDFIESTREAMLDAAALARDLDPASADRAAAAEDRVYGVWKGAAPYGPLLQEDLRRQSNATASASAGGAAAGTDQREALELTGLFKERFSAAVPEQGTPAPATENEQPPGGAASNAAPQAISAETRAEVLRLSDDAAAAQRKAVESVGKADWGPARDEGQKARDLLLRIQELLPKPPPQPSPQEQQDEQKKEQKPQEQKGEQQEKPQTPPEDRQQAREQPPQEQTPEQKEEQPRGAKGEMSRDEMERLLEKALQREKEHEAEKRERDRRIPMSPSERDW